MLPAVNLWAIASYFNPAGDKRRLLNYRAFRARLTVPLVVVELSFSGEFDLRPEDAEILIQLRGCDVMWQKERLLNIALHHVPSSVRKIAWLDCDVIFEEPDWAEAADRLLDRSLVVQLFQSYDLPRTTRAEAPLQRTGSLSGLAWAAQRWVLEKHGFYDAGVMGGGDWALACAACGDFPLAVEHWRMNPRREDHYLAWARPYFESVRGEVGFLESNIFHLWHGEMYDRQWGVRHRLLRAVRFRSVYRYRPRRQPLLALEQR